MSIRIITYDLNKEADSEDYTSIIDYIKTHSWARLSESSYAIETEKLPHAIYSDLEGFLDEGDRLLVLTLTAPYYGINRKDVVDWLDERL